MEVKTINGYSIKDETARNKIENMKEKVKLVFPKFWTDVTSGDCNIIKYSNKTVMIDCYNIQAWPHVRNMLLDNDVNHLDYLIISHYHGDHVANIENLIEYGYVDSNTTVYLPADTYYLNGTNGYPDIASAITFYKSLLDNSNISYIVPEENSSLIIKDLEIVFFNCDADELETYYYDNGIKDYNQYSTVNLIKHQNRKYLYMGDGGPNTYQRLIDTKFITGRVDLFKLGHHGHNTSTNIKFMNLIQPEYVIEPCGINDFILDNFSIGIDTPILKNNGSKIYPTVMQPDYIIFLGDVNHINCINGYEYSLSNNLETINLYVDKNASQSKIQDGSQNSPFTEVMQAIGTIKSYPQYNYNIYIEPGEYGLAHPTDNKKRRIYITTGKDSLVRLIGNGESKSSVTLSDVIINNSSVILQNLTIDVDNLSTNYGLYAHNSNVVINDIDIKSMTDTNNSNVTGINVNWNSDIRIQDVFIDNVDKGIATTHSSISANSMHFGDDINDRLFNPYNSLVRTNTITIDDETQNASFVDNYKRFKTPIELFSGDESSSVTLNKNANLFDWIEITYKSDNNIYNATGKIYSPNGKNVGLGIFYIHSGGNIYNKQAMANISGTSITISLPTQVQISDTGDDTVVKKTTTSGLIHITKVVGGFDTGC